MVNLRALTPGHVMVCPTRVVQLFKDLTELETLELFVCAKEISKRFEDAFKVKSFSFIIQDGDSAGQQVKHAHLHIIPRDDSTELRHIKFDNVPERNPSEMAEEAETFRQIFEKNSSDAVQFTTDSSRYL